mmetsp:Transcript_9101/g.23052  ORF Transcript_9101/g.23052 Transcript_9101/m.23052 type:complete len:97 (+) Transcript_9101:437-727(+)
MKPGKEVTLVKNRLTPFYRNHIGRQRKREDPAVSKSKAKAERLVFQTLQGKLSEAKAACQETKRTTELQTSKQKFGQSQAKNKLPKSMVLLIHHSH